MSFTQDTTKNWGGLIRIYKTDTAVHGPKHGIGGLRNQGSVVRGNQGGYKDFDCP